MLQVERLGELRVFVGAQTCFVVEGEGGVVSCGCASYEFEQ